MKEIKTTSIMTRRAAVLRGAQSVAVFTVAMAGLRSALAKSKSAKEDFYFQETPDDSGRACPTCINFTAKPTGLYGKDSGDCALLEGDVCTHCYCQGWTDKNSPGAKKAGT